MAIGRWYRRYLGVGQASQLAAILPQQTGTIVSWTFALEWPIFRPFVVAKGAARNSTSAVSWTDSVCLELSKREDLQMINGSLVSVVDDDESVRESLPGLLSEFGCTVHAYASAEDFLSSDSVTRTECLILDIAMPGMSGLELQRELTQRQRNIPIVFLTAHTDQAIRERVIAEGAVDCLFKPFSPTVLWGALRAALESR